MLNPFSREYSDETDDRLIEEALAGSKHALQVLILRHQSFVFNVALKMFGVRADAEDLTQQILVKAITSLRSFRRESAFRTWLYRMTVNEFLSCKRRGRELVTEDFATYFDSIAAVADEQITEAEQVLEAGTIEELRIQCTTGMLACLNRPQRIVLILGDIFGADHQLGAEMTNTTPANFRVQLSRARRDLREWMNNRCGLVNPLNSCRCHKKARAYVRAGAVDGDSQVFNREYMGKIGELARTRSTEVMDAAEELRQKVFADHPFEVMNDGLIRGFFDV
ncbi:MAG: RNA polymerase sigma factor [Fibrobacteria bacterium]